MTDHCSELAHSRAQIERSQPTDRARHRLKIASVGRLECVFGVSGFDFFSVAPRLQDKAEPKWLHIVAQRIHSASSTSSSTFWRREVAMLVLTRRIGEKI